MRTQQFSFAGGFVSGDMFGRVDLRHRQTGFKGGFNWIVKPNGALENRTGLQHIKEFKDGGVTPVRLIDFVFNEDQAYVLEFGELYLRIHLEGATALESDITITGVTQTNPVVITTTTPHGYFDGEEVFISGIVGMTKLNARYFKIRRLTATAFEITDLQDIAIDGRGLPAYVSGGTSARVYTVPTPYSASDLFEIKHVQSEDVMTLSHTSYDRMELRRLGATNWQFTTITDGPTIARPTDLASFANPAVGADEYHFYTVTAVEEDLLEESLPAQGKLITGATQANPVVISSTGHGLSNGDRVWIQDVEGMTEINNDIFIVANVTANTFELQGIDGTAFTAYTSSGHAIKGAFNKLSTVSNLNTISWSEVSGAIRYNVYKLSNGLFGLIGQTTALSFVDDNINPDVLNTPPIDQQPFGGADDRPGAVGYFDARRIFGGTNNRPATAVMSRTGTESNFTKSIPTQADDAITAKLKSETFNKIVHFVGLSELVILTTGGEWRMVHDETLGVTPTTVRFREQSNIGSGHLKPFKVGASIVFGALRGGHVYDLNFSSDQNRWNPTDLSRIAHDLFDTFTISDWCYVKSPYPLGWQVRSDGSFLGMTYLPEEQPPVLAWHQHSTQKGTVESTAAIPENNGEEMAYFAVRRKIKGVYRRFLERLHTRVASEVEDDFFVDAGLTYDNPVAITGATQTNPVVVTAPLHGFSNGDIVQIKNVAGMVELNDMPYTLKNVTADTFEIQDGELTPADIDGTAFTAYESGGKVRLGITALSGLEHLEGEEVEILSDGSVEAPKTVLNGEITLDKVGFRVHVGLGITSDLELLPLLLPVEDFGKGSEKLVSEVFLEVYSSRGMSIGPDFDHLTPYLERTFEKFGEPTQPRTGEICILIDSSWSKEGSVVLRKTDPTRSTLLSMAQEVSFAS